MMLRACPREKEVKEMLALGQWPTATAPELRAHVGGCRNCQELVLLSTAFLQAKTNAVSEAKLAAPGLLWWRAQLRRRNAAVERISKPILGAQIFALAVFVALTVGLAVWQARSGLGWLTRLEALPGAAELDIGTLWSSALSGSAWLPMVMISVAAALVLLGGVVVYLSSEKQ